jgi:hypothetical protein
MSRRTASTRRGVDGGGFREDLRLKQELVVNIFDTRTGRLTGQLFTITVHHEFTSSTVINYLHRLGIQKETPATWGFGHGAQVDADTVCYERCNVTGGDGFFRQPVDAGPNTGGVADAIGHRRQPARRHRPWI